jgi:hypothetical protein
MLTLNSQLNLDGPFSLLRAARLKHRAFSPFRNAIPSVMLALACMVATPASAEVRSVTANPAEDCSTQMNIGWHADLGETSCSVVYTQKSDAAWAQAMRVAGKSKRSEVFDGIDSKTSDSKDWKEEAKFLDYGVTLTGLKPDTDYMYKVAVTCIRLFPDGRIVSTPFLMRLSRLSRVSTLFIRRVMWWRGAGVIPFGRNCSNSRSLRNTCSPM